MLMSPCKPIMCDKIWLYIQSNILKNNILNVQSKESISLLNNAATLVHIFAQYLPYAGPMIYLQASTEARRLQKDSN